MRRFMVLVTSAVLATVGTIAGLAMVGPVAAGAAAKPSVTYAGCNGYAVFSALGAGISRRLGSGGGTCPVITWRPPSNGLPAPVVATVVTTPPAGTTATRYPQIDPGLVLANDQVLTSQFGTSSGPAVLTPANPPTLNAPIVGAVGDPAVPNSWWEVASDGGIFSFDSPFYGSTGSIHLNQPIIGMEPMTTGGGYRFVARDGGIFDFGNAYFAGSAITGYLQSSATVLPTGEVVAIPGVVAPVPVVSMSPFTG